MAIREISVKELAQKARAEIREVRESGGQPGTLFTFLIGSGCSITAGLPSTTTLVQVMKARNEAEGEPPSWGELLDSADKGELQDLENGEAPTLYPELMKDETLFHSPQSRQRFITSVVRWSSSRQPEMNAESLRLAAILKSGTHGESQDARTSDLGRHLAHTVFTTNFDEVLPQTFRYCGEPVAVIDDQSLHGRIEPYPLYPRVVYLHGCHLFYNLRNTESELQRAELDRSGGVDLTGLFMRFREFLRHSSLIVLGYGGWQDRAMLAIEDALNDANSLPLGLYWGARDGKGSLSSKVRQLLESHSDRAHLLAPGQDAAQVLDSLCSEFDVDWLKSISSWSDRIALVGTSLHKQASRQGNGATSESQSAAEEGAAKLSWLLRHGQVLSKARRLFARYDVAGSRALLKELSELQMEVPSEARRERALLLELEGRLQLMYGHDLARAEQALRGSLLLREESGDLEGYASALNYLGHVLVRTKSFEEAEKLLHQALQLHENHGSPLEQGNVHLGLGALLLRQSRLDEASAAYEAAAQRHQQALSLNGQAYARSGLGRVDLRRSELARAEKLFLEALDLHRKAEDELGIAQQLFDIGELRLQQNDLAKAEESFTQSLQNFESLNDCLGKGNVQRGLAEVLRARGQLDQSRGRLDESRVLLEQAHASESLLEVDLALARLQHAEDDTSAARELATSIRTKADELGLALIAADADAFLAGLPDTEEETQ
ncbi:MAG: tetratricopeptide repeat protein [Acidobacteriota bacterium]